MIGRKPVLRLAALPVLALGVALAAPSCQSLTSAAARDCAAHGGVAHVVPFNGSQYLVQCGDGTRFILP